MIISKISLAGGGFCYITAGKEGKKTVDVAVYTSTSDMEIFQANYLESFDALPLKSRANLNNPEPMMKGCYSSLLPTPGKNTGCCKMTDFAAIRRNLVAVIQWLQSIGYSVTLTPVDERRLTATKRLLQGFTLEQIDSNDDFFVVAVK